MIPRILHLYWGRNRPLSYLRYRTYETFKRLNPSWEIMVWTTDTPTMTDSWTTGEQSGDRQCVDWFDKIPHPRPFCFESRGFPIGASEVHKSDFARWCLLSEEGGWWSDFDIYYVRPASDLPEAAFKASTVVCAKEWHSIGFLGSRPDSPVFATAAYLAAVKYDPTGYQCIGRHLLDELLPPKRMADSDVYNLPEHVVYPVKASPKKDILRLRQPVKIIPGCIGIHWFGGHPESAALERKTAPGNPPPFT